MIVSSLLPLRVISPCTAAVRALVGKSFTSSGATFKSIRQTMSTLIDGVQEADIDVGRFKYILIKVHHSPEGGPEISKFIVRGYQWAEYHSNVYDIIAPPLEKKGLDCECVGGGRITHNPDAKTIEVYGYSQGYGLADHAKSVEILKRKYPDYQKITWSNEGY